MTTAVPALEEGAIYLSPTGRRCRWVPTAKFKWLTFEYVDGPVRLDGARDQFTLTSANLRVLRRAGGQHAAAR